MYHVGPRKSGLVLISFIFPEQRAGRYCLVICHLVPGEAVTVGVAWGLLDLQRARKPMSILVVCT